MDIHDSASPSFENWILVEIFPPHGFKPNALLQVDMEPQEASLSPESAHERSGVVSSVFLPFFSGFLRNLQGSPPTLRTGSALQAYDPSGDSPDIQQPRRQSKHSVSQRACAGSPKASHLSPWHLTLGIGLRTPPPSLPQMPSVGGRVSDMKQGKAFQGLPVPSFSGPKELKIYTGFLEDASNN